MLATRANLPGYFLQKPGDVEQNRIDGPLAGHDSPREGREPGIGYDLGSFLGRSRAGALVQSRDGRCLKR